MGRRTRPPVKMVHRRGAYDPCSAARRIVRGGGGALLAVPGNAESEPEVVERHAVLSVAFSPADSLAQMDVQLCSAHPERPSTGGWLRSRTLFMLLCLLATSALVSSAALTCVGVRVRLGSLFSRLSSSTQNSKKGKMSAFRHTRAKRRGRLMRQIQNSRRKAKRHGTANVDCVPVTLDAGGLVVGAERPEGSREERQAPPHRLPHSTTH